MYHSPSNLFNFVEYTQCTINSYLNHNAHFAVASLSKDDTTPVNDSDHIMRDVSLSGIGDSFKEKSPLKDTITVENKYVNN